MKHEAEDASFEPDWEIPLTVTVTAASVIDTVFATAFSVHTGMESCINAELAVVDIVAPDDNGGNFTRYVEQEYAEDSDPEAMWHDWTVELKIDSTFVVGHWWTRSSGSPADWEWCAKEAGLAFRQASLFVGKRVRKGLVVEHTSWSSERGQRVHH